MLVIQRKIMKAQAIVHNSVKNVINVSRSRMPFKPKGKSSRLGPTDSISHDKSLPLFNSPLMVFAKEVLQNPRSVGAACPSSRLLSRAVAKLVPVNKPGLVIDLGAGTGIMTKALLQQGFAPERLVAIERSAHLAAYLRQHFPQVRVIEGDALELCDLLGEDGQHINTLIGGLPFRSLPPRVVHGVVNQIEEILPRQGLYMQYTYDLSGRDPHLSHHFKRVSSKIVWSNLPPARISVYRVEHLAN